MKTIARRQFLNFLAASPLLAVAGHSRLLLADDASDLPPFLIQSPDKALDVFDFHHVAKKMLPTAHYGYLATGTDGNETLAANRTAFEKVYLRAMRMVDTQNIDTETDLLGSKLKSPIVIAPVGSQNAFHAEGELATARAARTHDTLQILSNVATHSIEDVIAARGAPVGFQLYPTNNWSVASKMIKRAEKAGAEFVVLTVDLNSDSNRVLLGQYVRTDDRDCSACHSAGPVDALQRKPMYDGTGATIAGFDTSAMTWEYMQAAVCDTVPMPFMFPITVVGPKPADGVHLRVCPRSSRRSMAPCLSWSTAAFAGVLTSSRHWLSAQTLFASDAHISGDWRHLVNRASKRCLKY